MAISKMVQWACFTKTPFMRAVGLEAFGQDAMLDIQHFGQAAPSGRMIRMDSGVYAFTGQVFNDTGTSSHVGRLGSFQGQLVEGGTSYFYSWHRLAHTQYIPDVDIQDNGKGAIDIKAQKMEGMKKKYVGDINYCLLGNASAPDNGVMGPSSVNHDLTNLISVTQTATIGGISKSTNTFWNNGYKAIAAIGGGDSMDRPLTMRRSMLDAKNDQMQHMESTDDYLFLVTQGAWQYYDRLMYADTIQGRNGGGAMGTVAKYDAAGIHHKAFDGSPMVWDPAVTVPVGATAATESMYGIHIPSFAICLRSEEAFKVSAEWEPPRLHDLQKTYVAQILTRYTPAVTSMRPHFVCYNMPACPD